MVDGPDAVLVAIPVLALGGVLLELLVQVTAPTAAGRVLGPLPLDFLGFLAAAALVGYAMFRLPAPDRGGTDS